MKEQRSDIEHNEETRKIQLTGKSTYIVSLPKKWVTNMNLEAGSQIVVTRQGDASLLLTPKELLRQTKLGEARITVSQKDDPDMIARKIVALYLVGYNVIAIKTKEERITSLQKNLVKDFARRKLVGTEILSETPDEMKLQILLSYPELSVENALRRMCLIAISMHEDVIKALQSMDKALAKEVITLDDEVDRFSLYIIRQLKAAVQSEAVMKNIGLSNQRDCLGYRVIVKSVERIADHASKIAESVLELDEKVDNSVLQKISEIDSFARLVFDDATRSLYTKDYELANSVVSKAKTITAMENKWVRAFAEKEIRAISTVRMIMESIRRTAEYAGDIAEIVLNLTVDQIIAP